MSVDWVEIKSTRLLGTNSLSAMSRNSSAMGVVISRPNASQRSKASPSTRMSVHLAGLKYMLSLAS